LADTGPQEFGKYVLLSKLAAGGMAVTYRARMTGAAGVTKPCVIKQILPHFADDHDFVEMFIGEARVAAGLSHGNIAQVFDFGEVNGQYFIALELVQGQPLSKVLRKAAKAGMGFFPIPLALHVISKMCDGLDYAHRHIGEDGKPLGLVHRDVSPDNILISYEGEVKVIDFGIAKATSVVEQKTSPGVVKGKYPYFSPEQAQGRQDLDSRTDVYAAGVVLYEAVCGKRPFEGEFVTVLPRILAGDFAPPSQVNPAVSPELEDIIYRAMALDRDQRYSTAKELSENLVELLYRDNPRFTPTMLSQLVAHLFTEELTAEGRKVELPPSFAEQLAAWQSPGPSARSSSPGSGPRTPGGGNRTPSGSTRSATGSRPNSVGGPRGPNSNPGRTSSSGGMRVTTTGARRVSSPGARRATNPGGPVSGVRKGLPPSAEEAGDPTPPHGTPAPKASQPDETIPSRPALPLPAKPGQFPDRAAEVRAANAQKEAERAEKTQKLVRNISLGVFAVVVVLVLFVLLRPEEPEATAAGTTIWLTSMPEGAAVSLNGKPVKGQTPMFVSGFILNQANTLVLTAPGYLAWTKRFTPNSASEPPIHADLKRATAEPGPPSPTPKPPVAAAATPDAGPPPAKNAASPTFPLEDGTDFITPEGERIDFNKVTYPTRLLVLRTAYNAMPMPEYATLSMELNPGTSYSVRTDGGAAYTANSPTSSSLAFFLEGDLPVDESFGVLSGSGRTIKGAKRIHVFAFDENGLDDNRGTIRVQFTESKWKPPRNLVFDPQKHALQIKTEHQVELRGLNPKSTYLFTVRDDFAELAPSPKGRIRRALCMERSSASMDARRAYRLLEAGKRYQLDGLETLRCTYPDTKVSNNQGALEVDLVDITNMTRKQRDEYIRNAKSAER
jgi:serine/threonine protein kinase